MHFYASVTGTRTTIATKGGTKKTGMVANIRGWNIGVEVTLIHRDGRDLVIVRKTGGTHGVTDKEPLVILDEREDKQLPKTA